MGGKSTKVIASNRKNSKKSTNHSIKVMEIMPDAVLDNVATSTESKPEEKNVDETLSTTSSSFKPEFEHLIEEETSLNDVLNASTSISQTLDELGHVNDSQTVMIDAKTSTPQVSPCFCPETIFYHKNQHVGIESRHVEFKRGGVITDLRSFRTVVGRYLCAFLNTEGGTIFFGVTDNGLAIGVNVDQKNEDEIRLMVDNAVSTIRPTVPTKAYSLNFAKVMGIDGQLENNLKVLEICVKPRIPPQTLHSFDNNVYVRRDGSLRTL